MGLYDGKSWRPVETTATTRLGVYDGKTWRPVGTTTTTLRLGVYDEVVLTLIPLSHQYHVLLGHSLT